MDADAHISTETTVIEVESASQTFIYAVVVHVESEYDIIPPLPPMISFELNNYEFVTGSHNLKGHVPVPITVA